MEYGRTDYLRIQKNKFWAWVVVSLLVGLLLGLGIMYLRQAAMARQITTLKTQLATQSQDASASVDAMQKKLTENQALLAAATQKYNDLLLQQQQQADTQTNNTSSSTTTATVTVVSRTISPSTVATDGTIAMSAKVKGSADKVTMRITGPNGYDQTYSLSKTSSSGGTQTWRKSASAPKKAGTYRYYATAYSGDTKVTMVGASPSRLTVK